MTRLPNLRGLEAFVSVGETGSVRAAAAALSLTPSAVSRRIAALERDTDQVLMERTPRGIALTAEGQALHRVATKAFDAIATHLAQRRREYRAIVIKAPHSFASRWLAGLMPRLRERYPQLALTVATSPRIETLEPGEIAFRFGFGDWSDGLASKLIAMPMLAAARQGQAPPADGPLTRRDLAASRLLVVGGTERVWRLWLAANALGPLDGLDVLAFDNTDVAVRAAAAGAGFTLVGAGLDDPIDGPLQRYPATMADVGAGFYLVVPRTGGSVPPLRDLTGWLKAQFR